MFWLCLKTCQFGCKHEYESRVYSRTQQNTGCTFCSHRKVCFHQSLEYLYPNIAAEWHPTLNGNLKPSDVAPKSKKKFFWLCQKTCQFGCKHEYEASICHRTHQNTGCAFCSHIKVCFHQSLEYLYPNIAA